jgi:hypothetical protein
MCHKNGNATNRQSELQYANTTPLIAVIRRLCPRPALRNRRFPGEILKARPDQNQRMVYGCGALRHDGRGDRGTASTGCRGHPHRRVNLASYPIVTMAGAQGLACLRWEVHAAQEVLEARVGAQGVQERLHPKEGGAGIALPIHLF